MLVVCHDRRAYLEACLPHVSLNELLCTQEARGKETGVGRREGWMDRAKEETDERKEREHTRDSQAEQY